jgi:hypothetical protein
MQYFKKLQTALIMLKRYKTQNREAVMYNPKANINIGRVDGRVITVETAKMNIGTLGESGQLLIGNEQLLRQVGSQLSQPNIFTQSLNIDTVGEGGTLRITTSNN